MNKVMYQVRLRQDDMETLAWIEERGAKLGAMVEVRILDGLWQVVEVLKSSVPEMA